MLASRPLTAGVSAVSRLGSSFWPGRLPPADRWRGRCRDGYVGLPGETTESRWQDGFIRGLRELGYVPGQTIVLDARTYTTPDQLRNVLDEFVRHRSTSSSSGSHSLPWRQGRRPETSPSSAGPAVIQSDNGLAASPARSRQSLG